MFFRKLMVIRKWRRMSQRERDDAVIAFTRLHAGQHTMRHLAATMAAQTGYPADDVYEIVRSMIGAQLTLTGARTVAIRGV